MTVPLLWIVFFIYRAMNVSACSQLTLIFTDTRAHAVTTPPRPDS